MGRAERRLVAAGRRAQPRGVADGQQRQVFGADPPGTGQHDGIGRFRLPRRPVLSWMLSAGQRLISDEGSPVGRWRPHLMIYYPYLTAAELGLDSTSDLKNAVLVDGGTPTSNLMIVTSEFVQPEPSVSPAR